MKHTALLSFTMMLFLSIIGLFSAHAQPVVTITTQLSMSPNPSPYLSDWQSAPQTIVLNASLVQPYNQPVKLMAQVTLNGQVVARTNVQKMRLISLHQGMNSFTAVELVPYSAVDFVGGIDRSAQRAGRLPEGNYQLCTWFVDGENGREIGGSACNPFAIQDVQSPTLLLPANGAIIGRPAIATKTSVTSQQFKLSQLASLSGSQLDSLHSFDLVSGGNHFLYAMDPKITERDSAEAMQIPIMTIRPVANTAIANTSSISTAACGCGCGGTTQPRCATKGCSCASTQATFNRYQLKDVLVGNQTVSGHGSGDPRPTESISLQFSWLPPMPMPVTPVQYRLKIVEILPGQSPNQALQTGVVLADKDHLSATIQNIIDILTTDVIDLLFPRVVVPNNQRQFVWSVQAHDLQGNPIGKNNGWAEPRIFDIGNGKPSDSTTVKLSDSFFDVFSPIDHVNTTTNEPCPYKYKVLRRTFYTPCTNGWRSKYQVWGVFSCSLFKGHSGPHHGTVDEVMVLVGSVGCTDDDNGTTGTTPIEPLPTGAKIIKRDSIDKIPTREQADKLDVAAAGAVMKVPCPYTEKKLLRTVAGSWKRGKTTVRHVSYHGTTVAWADVTWSRDIWNVYFVKHCTLLKGHGGAHVLDSGKEEFEKYGTITETVTYGTGVPQVPPKSAADELPQEDPPTK